jgi:hypothetical protein
VAVIRAYSQTVITLALEGHKVSTPLVNCGISIKGVFVSQTDTFNSSRHSIEATVSPGPEFKRLVREKGQVQQQEANKPQPNPLEYLDLGSGQRNSGISAGRVAQVNGHRLKFDPADPSQGVFFIAVIDRATLYQAWSADVAREGRPGFTRHSRPVLTRHRRPVFTRHSRPMFTK